MAKNIYGKVEVTTYKNGKCVDRDIRNVILNETHWRKWSKLDKNLGARTNVRANFDYKEDTRLITSYSTSLGKNKKVYKRIF